MNRRLRVGVIFGGRSGEHEVSLASANSVMQAIDRHKYDVLPIGITKRGRWLLGSGAMQVLTGGREVREQQSAAMLPDPTRSSLMVLEEKGSETVASFSQQVDVVVPVLHGTFGEDGTIQGLLELAGVPYVGAGVLASAVGMDKEMMKAVFAHNGLPLVKYTTIKRDLLEHDPAEARAMALEAIGCPCFVKPANLGSSVGISKAHDEAELVPALTRAAKYDRKIVVEEAVDAREIECAVLGNDNPLASVAGEIVPCNEFYDYRAKYVDDKSELVIPADLPPETSEEVRRLAVAAFRAIDCAGMARVDFFIRRSDGKVLVNEINTIPGFTSISMYPKLWEASGVSYPDLIDRLIQLALERHRDKSRSQTWLDD